jgi:hypothetical protein
VQLFAEQPAAAVGPVDLGLQPEIGLEADLRVELRPIGAQGADPPGERGVGALVAEVTDLAQQRRGPKLRTQLEAANDVGELGLGELHGAGPRAVADGRLRGGVAAGGAPVDVELPGDLRDRPPVAGVERVHHEPVLLTLHLSLPVRGRGLDTGTLAGGTPLFQQHEDPEGAPRGLFTFRDQDWLLLVISHNNYLNKVWGYIYSGGDVLFFL